MATEPIFIGDVVGQITTIGVINTVTTVYTGDAAKPVRVDSICVVNNDSVEHTMKVYMNDGTTDHLLATVAVPADAGTLGGSASYNLLCSSELVPFSHQDNAANTFMDLPKNWSIKAELTTALTNGVDVFMQGGTY